MSEDVSLEVGTSVLLQCVTARGRGIVATNTSHYISVNRKSVVYAAGNAACCNESREKALVLVPFTFVATSTGIYQIESFLLFVLSTCKRQLHICTGVNICPASLSVFYYPRCMQRYVIFGHVT